MRKKDAVLLALFTGALSVILIVIIFAMFIPPIARDKILDWDELFASLPAFRFIFMLILTLFFTAVDIKILREFKVNYLFIFELDPHYKITHIQLFRVKFSLINFCFRYH